MCLHHKLDLGIITATKPLGEQPICRRLHLLLLEKEFKLLLFTNKLKMEEKKEKKGK